MSGQITAIKKNLDDAITQLCEVSWMFSKRPAKDFTRGRKLPLRKMISLLLAMEGGTLTNELLKHFGCSADIASSSAFVQQRSKINTCAFPSLFDLFVKKTDNPKRYKGLRLLAVDGSDFQIPTNPNHTDSYFPRANGQAPYNMLHLDAMYDLLQHTYVDAVLLGQRNTNEQRSLCSMVDRSGLKDVLVIADRGYEGYNVLAHIQEKTWKYLIRIKDIHTTGGFAAGLSFPVTDEFDMPVNLNLITRQTAEAKVLCRDKNSYRFIPSTTTFDFLSRDKAKHSPLAFYSMPFRVVRFKISDDIYETVVTNLDVSLFPAGELKKLYNMRWGIETSFRELKYTVGLLHFHAKKVEHICQEIFARLIMYNFSELVTSHVIIQKAHTKYAYKANFSVAVHVCRQFFLGNVSPPDAEALIRRHVSPIRPGRSRPRKMTVKHAVSFIYRVA